VKTLLGKFIAATCIFASYGVVSYGVVAFGTVIVNEVVSPQKRKPVGVITDLPTTDGIMRWDPAAPHYWLVETVPGTEPALRVLDDYSKPEECWQASFTAGPSNGPWRVCVPLDEPAEEFLARYITERAYGAPTGR
jgi:hypothetical protein